MIIHRTDGKGRGILQKQSDIMYVNFKPVGLVKCFSLNLHL